MHFSHTAIPSVGYNTQELKKKFIDFIIKIHYVKTGQSVSQNSTCFNLMSDQASSVYQSYNDTIHLWCKYNIGNIDPISPSWVADGGGSNVKPK